MTMWKAIKFRLKLQYMYKNLIWNYWSERFFLEGLKKIVSAYWSKLDLQDSFANLNEIKGPSTSSEEEYANLRIIFNYHNSRFFPLNSLLFASEKGVDTMIIVNVRERMQSKKR